jgi:hypothetical protein
VTAESFSRAARFAALRFHRKGASRNIAARIGMLAVSIGAAQSFFRFLSCAAFDIEMRRA